ncbi:glucosaminidase domain-containing protein [Psychromonas sp. MME2]|uniref:glucosaminidase domain-containing protein n=1 Tax=Psychromonas sp. MME2 TaxID=3231033 RepID=UPI00339C1A73
MKKRLFACIALVIAGGLFITACSENSDKQVINVPISSLDDLYTLFDKYQYTDQQWTEGNHEIPRMTFAGVGEKWAESSKNLPVQTKKMVFFRLMAPLALMANEQILAERKIVKTSPLNSEKLRDLALKYKVIDDQTKQIDENARKTLLKRVDILPPSLVLAQAAEESGWATSRFTLEGNAFFGQWDFTGKGMKPLAQRSELGNYGVARFDSPLASVEAYMLNVNSNNAYQSLRTLRSKLRAEKKSITGYLLAGTLHNYSERGQAYIDGIRAMISHNKLQQIDKAHLAKEPLIHLINE